MLRNRGIRSRRPEQADVAAPAQLAAEPEWAAQPVRAFGATGVAAMDILPARSGGRGLLRRRSAATAPPPVGGPGVAAGTAPGQAAVPDRATTPPTPASPEAAALEPIAWDAAPAQALPAPVVSAVAEPEPAPSSLFAPAPASVPEVSQIVPAQPVAAIAAPSSLFLPAPAASEGPGATAEGSSEPAPVGTPASPGLTSTQSLRERSAMASEALSELSALSTYTPQGVPAQPRRTATVPPAEGTGQPVQPGEEPLGARRGTRNAADVRSMLSGARSAGDRGIATGSGAVPVHAQP